MPALLAYYNYSVHLLAQQFKGTNMSPFLIFSDTAAHLITPPDPYYLDHSIVLIPGAYTDSSNSGNNYAPELTSALWCSSEAFIICLKDAYRHRVPQNATDTLPSMVLFLIEEKV